MKKIVNIDGKGYVEKAGYEKMRSLPQSIHNNPFMVIGTSYFIRTVTHYYTGRLIWVGDNEIVLEDVCWIADTGRFNEFMAGKTVNESEPYPKLSKVIIGRGSIIDMSVRDLVLTVK